MEDLWWTVVIERLNQLLRKVVTMRLTLETNLALLFWFLYQRRIIAFRNVMDKCMIDFRETISWFHDGLTTKYEKSSPDDQYSVSVLSFTLINFLSYLTLIANSYLPAKYIPNLGFNWIVSKEVISSESM